jgi:hypothetical protein
MPGSSGGFGQQQNQGGSDLPAMLGSGVNPNILSEESRGGGGYSPPVGANTDGSGFEFRNRFGGLPSGPGPAGNPGKSFQGMDLKKFLPGGVQDPRRNIAGISDYHPDIGPKHIDFFQRVSTRLQTLCKLKRLLDCN